MTNEGKTYNIISTDGISKKANQFLKEIISIISKKNEKVIIGYNKKNETEIKEILKDNQINQ